MQVFKSRFTDGATAAEVMLVKGERVTEVHRSDDRTRQVTIAAGPMANANYEGVGYEVIADDGLLSWVPATYIRFDPYYWEKKKQVTR